MCVIVGDFLLSIIRFDNVGKWWIKYPHSALPELRGAIYLLVYSIAYSFSWFWIRKYVTELKNACSDTGTDYNFEQAFRAYVRCIKLTTALNIITTLYIAFQLWVHKW